MRNFKNRKRFTAVAIAFMLTFLVGAAFAFAPGQLDIFGMIGVSPGELCVVWTNEGTTTQSTPAVATTNVTRRIAGVGGDNHRLEWAIGFVDGQAGTVTLTATATNNGTVDAELLAPTFAWGQPFGAEGFLHTMDSSAFVGHLPVGGTSGNLVVTIEMPPGWTMPLIAPFMTTPEWFAAQLPDAVYEIMTSFSVNLVYELYVP
jgi:hypothetical protein